jgi:hypothetical protein
MELERFRSTNCWFCAWALLDALDSGTGDLRSIPGLLSNLQKMQTLSLQHGLGARMLGVQADNTTF